MKIRTDFVTNSSSSSFTVLTIRTKDGRQFAIDREEMVWDESNMCQFKDGKLTYCYEMPDGEDMECKVQSIEELLAILYFNDIEEPLPYDAMVALFSFWLGTLSAQELLSALEEIEAFEELQEIDLEEFEEEAELREAVQKALESGLDEFDAYVNFEDEELKNSFREVTDNLSDLTEIAEVVAHVCDTDWGEFLNTYFERLNHYLAEENLSFVSIAEDDPAYPAAVTYWNDVLQNILLDGAAPLSEDEQSACVRAALASGNPYDFIPNVLQSFSDISYQISE